MARKTYDVMRLWNKQTFRILYSYPPNSNRNLKHTLLHRSFAVLCTLFLTLASYAQVKVSGTITDVATGAPIQRATVRVVGNGPNAGNGTVATRSGKYSIKVWPGTSTWLKFQHVRYRTDSILIRPTQASPDLILNIQLEPEAVELKTFTVTNEPEEVFGSIDFSVSDFAFGHNNRLILLAYDKGLHKDPRIVLAENNQPKHT